MKRQPAFDFPSEICSGVQFDAEKLRKIVAASGKKISEKFEFWVCIGGLHYCLCIEIQTLETGWLMAQPAKIRGWHPGNSTGMLFVDPVGSS